jgi:hypothetical protein
MKKGSIGVRITGLLLLIIGSVQFFGCVFSIYLMFYNTPMLIRILKFAASFSKIIRESGVPLEKWAEGSYMISQMVYADHPSLFLFATLGMPLVSLLFIMGGFGILRLREDWRKVLLIAAPAWAASRIIEEIFAVSYLSMVIIVGKIVNTKIEDAPQAVSNFMKILPEMLTKKLVYVSIPAVALIFFLTRLKVRQQFLIDHQRKEEG